MDQSHPFLADSQWAPEGLDPNKTTVVLAYSGGLDTSVSIPWIKEHYDANVVAVTADIGQPEIYPALKDKAIASGAAGAVIVDATDPFVDHYISLAIRGNLLYQGIYPAGTALARPLITEVLVEVAKALGATAIAHGCTAKGNDQVRFETAVAALAPHLKVIAPMREWQATREEEIAYAKDRGVPVSATVASPFSVDENLWGRSVEAGVLEDPGVAPPEEAFAWTTSPLAAPEQPSTHTVAFESGLPVSLDGNALPLKELIFSLNDLAGRHGVGRIDHVEDRVVGLKSRELYEYPAAMVLLAAHKKLEQLTLTKGTLQIKRSLELLYAQLVYDGLMLTQEFSTLTALMEASQGWVSGEVTVQLYKGSVTVTGVRSPVALYSEQLATYSSGDEFRHDAAEGFIYVHALNARTAAAVQGAQPGALASRGLGPKATAPSGAELASTSAEATPAESGHRSH